MSNGNGSNGHGSVRLLYWIMGALLAALLGLVQFNAATAQREVDALRQQLYTHEMQSLGGFQRISSLEAKVAILEQACACAASLRVWAPGGRE